MSRKLQFLLTAGPTREPIDPVRFISNRSSGRMGYSLAMAAAERGHRVLLVSGPVCLAPILHPGVKTIRVETARQMYEAVAETLNQVQIAVMTAAVADYRPRFVAVQKIKKTGLDSLVIELEKTDDILGSARSPLGFQGVLVGFAAETERLEEHAREKLKRKECDLIVANDVSRGDIGFDAGENEVGLFFTSGERQLLPKLTKVELASRLIEVIEALAAAKDSATTSSHE